MKHWCDKTTSIEILAIPGSTGATGSPAPSFGPIEVVRDAEAEGGIIGVLGVRFILYRTGRGGFVVSSGTVEGGFTVAFQSTVIFRNVIDPPYDLISTLSVLNVIIPGKINGLTTTLILQLNSLGDIRIFDNMFNQFPAGTNIQLDSFSFSYITIP